MAAGYPTVWARFAQPPRGGEVLGEPGGDESDAQQVEAESESCSLGVVAFYVDDDILNLYS